MDQMSDFEEGNARQRKVWLEKEELLSALWTVSDNIQHDDYHMRIDINGISNK